MVDEKRDVSFALAERGFETDDHVLKFLHCVMLLDNELAKPTNSDVAYVLDTLTVPNKPNQLAVLRVQYFDASNNPGPEVDKTVYLFNLLGDTDASGVVDQADRAMYQSKQAGRNQITHYRDTPVLAAPATMDG